MTQQEGGEGGEGGAGGEGGEGGEAAACPAVKQRVHLLIAYNIGIVCRLTTRAKYVLYINIIHVCYTR